MNATLARTVFAAALLAACNARADLLRDDSWVCNLDDRPNRKPHELRVARGETVRLTLQFKYLGAAKDITGAERSELRFYPGDPGTNSWHYVVTGTVVAATSGTIRAVLSPASLPAAARYVYEFAAVSNGTSLLSEVGQLRLDPGVGDAASVGTAATVAYPLDWALQDNRNTDLAPFWTRTASDARYIGTGAVDGVTCVWSNGQLSAIAADSSDAAARAWLAAHTNAPIRAAHTGVLDYAQLPERVLTNAAAFLPRDGSLGMLANFNGGGYSMTNVGSVTMNGWLTGCDIDGLGAYFASYVESPWFIGNGVDLTNIQLGAIVGLTPAAIGAVATDDVAYAHAVTQLVNGVGGIDVQALDARRWSISLTTPVPTGPADIGAVATNDSRYLASITNLTGSAISAAGGVTGTPWTAWGYLTNGGGGGGSAVSASHPLTATTNGGVVTVGLTAATFQGATWPKALWANSTTGSYYWSDIVPGTNAINIVQYTNKVIFGALSDVASNNPTQDQTWTCPAGVTNVYIQCWGAGGGGGVNPSLGGAGGYASLVISLVAGQNYTVRVGRGGPCTDVDGAQSDASYPGPSGRGKGGNANGTSGSGGGYSAVLSGTNFIIVAGGGGGAGAASTGGAGGGSTGANGTQSGTGAAGTGGSQSAAGTYNGSGNAGGNAILTPASNNGAGGGGAGYFGGGGGSNSVNSSYSSGGGGSCYVSISSQGTSVRGNNSGADDYQAPWGTGGAVGGTGSDGAVVIRYGVGL